METEFKKIWRGYEMAGKLVVGMFDSWWEWSVTKPNGEELVQGRATIRNDAEVRMESWINHDRSIRRT